MINLFTGRIFRWKNARLICLLGSQDSEDRQEEEDAGQQGARAAGVPHVTVVGGAAEDCVSRLYFREWYSQCLVRISRANFRVTLLAHARGAAAIPGPGDSLLAQDRASGLHHVAAIVGTRTAGLPEHIVVNTSNPVRSLRFIQIASFTIRVLADDRDRITD